MREILFRGQTRRKGEKVKMSGEPVESNWVYGGIFPTENGDRAIIYQQEPEIEKYPVYADTVGQYTGLKDKNGKKIFEGDIVRGVAYGSEWIGVIIWIDKIASFGLHHGHEIAWENCSILKRASAGMDDEFTAEVIGNIYDHPELMEGGGDG